MFSFMYLQNANIFLQFLVVKRFDWIHCIHTAVFSRA